MTKNKDTGVARKQKPPGPQTAEKAGLIAGPDPFVVEERSVGYVIILAEQGNVTIQVKPQELSNVFGKFGPAHFAALPNGYVVQMGPANQLLFQPPRVEFKSASEEMLQELYKNASGRVLGQFTGRSATAFGVNFHIQVTFHGMDAAQVFGKLRPKYLAANTSLQGAMFKVVSVPRKEEYGYMLERVDGQPASVSVNVNRHVPSPNRPFLTPGELALAISEARDSYKGFLNEVRQCIQSHS